MMNANTKGYGQHVFSQIPKAEIERSSFDRSSGLKTAFNGGLLVPIFIDEALPGDTISLKTTTFARMATLLFPIMDNAQIDTFFFAVPLRLLWDNFNKFMGEQTNPGDSTDFLTPILINNPTGFFEPESMGDYFGIPTGAPQLGVQALPFRAYNLIYNEWFRDENLIDSAVVPKDDGPDDETLYPLRRRGKRHDYFTSCLPFAQKGDPVTIGLGGVAPVVADGYGFPLFRDVTATDFGMRTIAGNTTPGWSLPGPSTTAYTPPSLSPVAWSLTQTGLEANLSAATTITINELRTAFQMQRLFERDARGGTRYTEITRSHFGVTSPDSRLQRPEYLGGGSVPISVNPVPQTTRPTPTATQGHGTLAAYVTAAGTSNGFTQSFTEHCLIIGLACAKADLTYQRGLNKLWSRRTRFDYFWPALAHLGEQAVLSKEIYADGTPGDEDVFGYQERYAEYRYKPSQITGVMRSQHPLSLDAWHLSQDFTTRPFLNQIFIEENPPFERAISTPSEAVFLVDMAFHMKHVRPMPTYGVPGMIDHF